MSNYKIVRNPFTKKLQRVVSDGYIKLQATSLKFKEGVDNVANLPSSGNIKNDVRITNDNHHLYVWDGTAWQDEGDILDINWASINGKPSSTPTEIDDTVSKKHAQNTDEYLDTQVTKILNVDKNRTDSYTPNGSITKPYKLIQSAIGSITDASFANRYAIFINPGDYSELISCKPYISFVGISREVVKLSGLVTINITNGRIAFKNLAIAGGLDMDTSVANSILDLEHCWVTGGDWDINCFGSGGSNYFQTWDVQFQVNITINNTFMAFQDTLMYGNIVMNGDSHAQFYNGEYYGTTDLNGTTDYIIKSVNPYPPAIINVNTVGASLSYDAEFGGATINNPGGGTITLLDKASKIKNDSSVVGATVKDALNELAVRERSITFNLPSTTIADGESMQLYRFTVPSGKSIKILAVGISSASGSQVAGSKVQIYNETDMAEVYSTNSTFIKGNPISTLSLEGKDVSIKILNGSGLSGDFHAFISITVE